LPKRDYVSLNTGEVSFRREENNRYSKSLKVHMDEFNGSNNSSKGFINDEVALMSKKFEQMMKKKRKFHHSTIRKGTSFKKRHKEESNVIIYFKCQKPKHMKVECP